MKGSTPILSALQQLPVNGRKALAVLVDPDKGNAESWSDLAKLCQAAKVDHFFVGGSLMSGSDLNLCIKTLKQHSNIPVTIFPGSAMQIDASADALLLLSLISGRNAELLIGQHVMAAPYLKKSGLELLPTGYMLIDGGQPTTVSYISNTQPIPHNKPDIAAAIALAGTQLGLQVVYLDAGSGAAQSISSEMVAAVRKQIEDIPLLVGGGIRSAATAKELVDAGADMLVVGNVLEHSPELVLDIAAAIHDNVKTPRL